MSLRGLISLYLILACAHSIASDPFKWDPSNTVHGASNQSNRSRPVAVEKRPPQNFGELRDFPTEEKKGQFTHLIPAPKQAAGPLPISLRGLCENPAQYLCNKSYNGPRLEEDARSRASFKEQIEKADRENVAYQEYLRRHKVKNCLPLEVQKWRECKEIRDEFLKKRLFTDERIRKTNEVFSKAKESMIGVLEGYLRRWSSQMPESRRSGLSVALGKMRSAKAHYGTHSQLDDVGYNMEASDYDANFDRNPTVIVSGMILLSDTCPACLYFRMLHELSHLVDPCALGIKRGDRDYSAHPFSRELRCLHRSDSVGAHRESISCYENVEQKARELNVVVPSGVKTALKSYRDSSDSTCAMEDHFPTWDNRLKQIDGVPCHEPQVGEAFADWMATEALSVDLYGHRELSGIPERDKSDIFTGALVRSRSWDVLTNAATWLCSGYEPTGSRPEREKARREHAGSHPRAEDRVNAILFANPIIKDSVGCPRQYVVDDETLSDPWYSNSRIDKDFRQNAEEEGLPFYCGQHLYGHS